MHSHVTFDTRLTRGPIVTRDYQRGREIALSELPEPGDIATLRTEVSSIRVKIRVAGKSYSGEVISYGNRREQEVDEFNLGDEVAFVHAQIFAFES